MFPYDPRIAALLQGPVHSIPDVLGTLHAIDEVSIDGDGLKWFNRLYMQVTDAVETRVNTGDFGDPAWLALLDVEFARLYFSALSGYLTGGKCPGCWRALFAVRGDTRIARIQFALAGVNAHINHDLPGAIVATCTAAKVVPSHGIKQYNDYTNLNATLDGLIQAAKKELHVRLLGDALPPFSHLEDTIAAWGTSAAREQAWMHSEVLWYVRNVPMLEGGIMDGLDGLTTFGNKTLLAPVP